MPSEYLWMIISIVVLIAIVFLVVFKITIAIHKKQHIELQQKLVESRELLLHTKKMLDQSKRNTDDATKVNTFLKNNISQEVRNSLNNITSLSLLIANTNLTQTQKDFVDKINTSCTSLLTAAETILNTEAKNILQQNKILKKEYSRKTTPRTTQLNSEFAAQHPLEILIAEDDALNSQLMLKILAKLGYEPETVASGAEALEVLNEKTYDIIFMDVHMEVMDGLEATRMIRLCLDTQPVIIALTGSVMDTSKEACFDAGMNDYISKPVNIDELVATLEKWSAEKNSFESSAAKYN